MEETNTIEELVDDSSFIRYNNTIYCDICMLENLAKIELYESTNKIKLMQSIVDMCRELTFK